MRPDGFYWVIFLPVMGDRRWQPAEFFNGQWFITCVCEAIPAKHLVIGDPVGSLPEPQPEDLKNYYLSIAAPVGSA